MLGSTPCRINLWDQRALTTNLMQLLGPAVCTAFNLAGQDADGGEKPVQQAIQAGCQFLTWLPQPAL